MKYKYLISGRRKDPAILETEEPLSLLQKLQLFHLGIETENINDMEILSLDDLLKRRIQ